MSAIIQASTFVNSKHTDKQTSQDKDRKTHVCVSDCAECGEGNAGWRGCIHVHVHGICVSVCVQVVMGMLDGGVVYMYMGYVCQCVCTCR